MKFEIKKNNKINWILTTFLTSLILVTSCNESDNVQPDDDLSITQLQGEWTRVESNNPNADNIKVNVVDDQATVIDNAESNYSVGALIWKDIILGDNEIFEYDQLGSDGNYYDATITLLDNNTLEISIVSSGVGNAQEWVRNPTQ